MKAQKNFFIAVVALIILNLVGDRLYTPLIYGQLWYGIGFIISITALIINIIILYYAVKAGNYSILFVLLYWILSIVNLLRLYIFKSAAIANILSPIYLIFYSASWCLLIPDRIIGKTFQELFGPLIALPPHSLILLIVSIIFVILSIFFTVRLFIIKYKSK